MKDNKLKKVYDKCKVIHALKPKLQNLASQNYGSYHYAFNDSRFNLYGSYMKERANLITLNRSNWKIRIQISCHCINIFYLFYPVTLVMVIPDTLVKQ